VYGTGGGERRNRFLPVKQCNDLMLVMSDLFTQEHGILTRNRSRDNPALPLVKLGKEFKKVSDFLDRFDSVSEPGSRLARTREEGYGVFLVLHF
jgi:hypothetical protein